MQSKQEGVQEVLNLFNSKNFELAETKIKTKILSFSFLETMVLYSLFKDSFSPEIFLVFVALFYLTKKNLMKLLVFLKKL